MLPRYRLPHLKFPPGEQRKFIQKALEISKLNHKSLAIVCLKKLRVQSLESILLGIFGPVKTFNKPKASDELAEFIGIMLGDGHADKFQISITLNSIADANYIHFVINLCKGLFKHIPRVLKRKKGNAKVIYYYGVNLVKYLVSLGLIPGNKVKNQVGVPSWISDNFNYKVACLRGLMDTVVVSLRTSTKSITNYMHT